jgi:hypothetical protein
MIFRNRIKNPRALMVVGMSSLVIATVFSAFAHAQTQIGKDWLEGLRGMFFGISIALNLGSVILSRRQRICSE